IVPYGGSDFTAISRVDDEPADRVGSIIQPDGVSGFHVKKLVETPGSSTGKNNPDSPHLAPLRIRPFSSSAGKTNRSMPTATRPAVRRRGALWQVTWPKRAHKEPV